MKIGDIVKLKDNPETEWMRTYKDCAFEVEEVFERNCRVRMLECLNPQRYWFVNKNVFEIVEK
jgi:hypothetical protein